MSTMITPGFKYEIIDQSNNPTIPSTEVPQPLFLMAASSDKGPEDMRVVTDKDFFKLYGDKDSNYFTKHGQPLLQAAVTAHNGGKILMKRVVADDAYLANTSIVAKISKSETQKVNDEGQPLYTDKSNGQETTTADGNEAIMVKSCTIKYEQVSVPSVKVLQSIITEIENNHEDETTFPLFTIIDNGRGVSNKKFRINPDYNDSKFKTYMKYNFDVIENSKVVETIKFSFDPDVVEANINRSLQNVLQLYSNQLVAKVYEDQIAAFIKAVAEASGNTEEYCKGNDLLFGKERKSVPLKNIKINLEDDLGNLSYVYGLSLPNGTNGAFGDKPFGKEAYNQQLIKFFNGTFDDTIFDLDNYKLDLLVDANYPAEVKREIEKLVIFREDLFYLRDLGVGLRTMEDILAADKNSAKNKFCASYLMSYDIIDPFTKKQIPVTVGYSLCKLLIEHFRNGRTRPLAGEIYGMILTDAIPGTVNFIPKITPEYDQKQQLTDARINYATYFDDKLVLETLFTSQEEPTQLSYINNILAIQEMIKAVRTRCPKIRYSFIDGKDLLNYKEDVEIVLRKYVSNFKTLKLVYLQDEAMVANKVFHAAIEVRFRDFVQTEYFKVYALQ